MAQRTGRVFGRNSGYVSSPSRTDTAHPTNRKNGGVHNEKKGEWSNRPACSAAPTICRRCSGKVHRRIGFHHQHRGKNWVLDDAGAMVHTEDGDSVSIGACTASIREWVCDGQRLFATIGVIDPALATEGYYVPKDDDEDYLAGLEHYGLTHELMEASSDDGYVQVRSADFDWGDETRFEILYTYEIELENMPSAFTVTIPVSCSAGESELSIAVTSTDYGTMRSFEPSEIHAFDGYTAQITLLKASSLRTYGELKLVFDTSIDAQTRENIAGDYTEGLLAPKGHLDICAGEGEEIAYPTSMLWQDNGLICTISLEGNPRKTYPDALVFYPRNGASVFDGEGEWPSLSEKAQ